MNPVRNTSFWLRAVRGDLTDTDWRQFVRSERLSAGVDFPTALFWRDLVRLYPTAKVLLTDRDPVKWYQSVKTTILEITRISCGPLSRFNPAMLLVKLFMGKSGVMEVAQVVSEAETALGPDFPRGMFGAVEDGEEEAVRFFTAWKAQVVKEVPASRLLVWQVREGWGPLCHFLGLEVPEEPFPSLNDTASMLGKVGLVRRVVLASWAVTAACMAAGIYCCS